MSSSAPYEAVATDTIVALSTPPGRGAIAVVRLSGPRALPLFLHTWSAGSDLIPQHRRILLGHIYDNGRSVDQVQATVYHAPHSYTGEDVVEIFCHGGRATTEGIVALYLRLGARAAEPGEYTLRAFLNGKMDLAQAEAVRDLIDAQTSFQAQIASEQLSGRLSQQLRPMKERLIEAVCLLETLLEFVEDDVQTPERADTISSLELTAEQLRSFAGTFQFGRLLHDGATVAIVGRPNVGKSSLFNALLREDRAIVTAIAGTTRDTVSENVQVEGIPVRLLDTAGLRPTDDPIERIGLQRARDALRDSDAVIAVVDGSLPLGADDEQLQATLQGRRWLCVIHKCDLPAARWKVDEWLPPGVPRCLVSSLTGQGLDRLRELIGALLVENRCECEDVLITSLRQKDAIEEAAGWIEQGIASLRSRRSEEFAAYELRKGLDALGRVTGETSVDDLLGKIFSTFCIGK